ncbi:hypothetical protein TRFO_02901 [Tritrichomonas foetus]|uniref:Uncharacterized protein n=1 Tax=Tritrichomonas foetus TaxID=1144522 RepID=A0A1J4KWE0_9EUKA|nr:hypothetical protein TRFO_02901 [Tritrichomonas foetus]|eukprot:OHT15555.1 hypothetical protein TRFO_02901 [Tritrichomonas foetus]
MEYKDINLPSGCNPKDLLVDSALLGIESPKSFTQILQINNISEILKTRFKELRYTILDHNYDRANQIARIIGLFFYDSQKSFSQHDLTNNEEILDILIKTDFLLSIQDEIQNINIFDNLIFLIALLSEYFKSVSKLFAQSNLLCNVISFSIHSNTIISDQSNQNLFLAAINIIKEFNFFDFDQQSSQNFFQSIIEFINIQMQRIPHSSIINFIFPIIKNDPHCHNFFETYLDVISHFDIGHESFTQIVCIVRIMLQINPNLVNLMLQNHIFEKLALAYETNSDILSFSYSCYLKMIKKVVKINSENYLFYLKPIYFKNLFDQLDGPNYQVSNEIIKIINLMLKQNHILEIFKDQRKLIRQILGIYSTAPLQEKMNILKLLTNMIKYSKFFRNEILSADLYDSFCDIIESDNENLQKQVLTLIHYALEFGQKKRRMPPLILDLMSSEFIELLPVNFQNSSNDVLAMMAQSVYETLRILGNDVL